MPFKIEKIINQAKFRILLDKWSEVEIPENDTPEVKIKKWGDEAYIKIKFNDFDKKVKPRQEGEKLKWKGKDMEVHVYPLEPTEQMTQGGFEFEIIFKKKPSTNEIVFDIETQGLSFYYQPELTQQEIDDGFFRPDNVIRSYAVYHEAKSGNYEALNGKNYKAGKAYHIYRPKIIDSNNWGVWGELNIDKQTNKLTVTIPQNFIDNAIYPIEHVAGLLFGNDSLGGSITGGWQYRLVAQKDAPAESGDVSTIDAGISDTGSGAALCGIYNSTGSTLIDGQETGELTNIGSKDFYTFTFSTQPSITASTDYLITVYGGAAIEFAYDSGSGMYHQYIGSYNSTMPSSWTPGSIGLIYSIYATYTPAAAEATGNMLLMFP